MRSQRLLPLIVATALFIENMDSTAIATSLPQIAADLGVSEITVKVRRGNAMRKLQLRSVADVVRLWDRLQALQTDAGSSGSTIS